ncbi:MAG: xanthine dehydrogenase family protein subunit M [Candidatus Omnitrophota bacterium]
MNKFEYVQAQSIEDAYQRLGNDYSSVKIMAGGTDLIGEMKEHIAQPQTIVSLSRLDSLIGIREESASIRIGVLTPLSEIARHPVIRDRYAALAQAAASVGSPQIRHAGTLGGNLCQRPRCWYYRDEQYSCLKKGGSICYSIAGKNKYHAVLGGGPCFIVHPSDCAPALVALGASVSIQGADGPRAMLLEDFFVLPQTNFLRENVLKSQEIVTEIEIPAMPLRSAYIKFKERDGFDWALASAAAALEIKNGICEKASLVLGGVAPAPWRAKKTEEFLQGKTIDESIARQAGELALDGAIPLSDNQEKVDIAKAIVKTAILSLKEGTTVIQSPYLY